MVEIVKGLAAVDIDRLHAWLSESYWANERTLDEQQAACAQSINYSAFIDGQMVGFARLVTDGVTFAWLCDVIVDPAQRGNGVGTALMDFVFADPEVLRVKRMLLGTRDAHALYRRYGFTDTEPGRIMRRGFKNLSDR